MLFSADTTLSKAGKWKKIDFSVEEESFSLAEFEAVNFQMSCLGLSKAPAAAPALWLLRGSARFGNSSGVPRASQSRTLLQPKMKPYKRYSRCVLQTENGRDANRQKKNETSVNKNIFLSYKPSPWPTTIHTSEHAWPPVLIYKSQILHWPSYKL